MRDQNDVKLTELMLYVGGKCATDEFYGVLKLNKILFYSDFFAFKRLGKPITGTEYRKYPHGPAPAVMKVLREKMQRSQDAFEYHNQCPSLEEGDDAEVTEKRLLPRRAAKMEVFTAAEISVVDEVMAWLRPKSGGEVSRMSHRHPGWALASMGEKIPYVTALLTDRPMPLSVADFARAKDIGVRHLATN